MIKKLIILTFLSFGLFLEAAQVFPGIEEKSSVTLKLKADEVAIFGYGSLMLEEELEQTEEDPYTGPFIMAKLKGFKRTWSAHYPNRYEYFKDEEGEEFKPRTIVFLNIEPYEGSKVNGMLFVCKKSQLWMYDNREAMYDRIRVNDYLEGVKVEGGDAYSYMAKPESYGPTKELNASESVIRWYYVEVIEDALDILGKDFRTKYEQSTQPVPFHLVF